MRGRRRMGSVLVAVAFAAAFLVAPGARAEAVVATPSPDQFYGTWSDLLSPTPEAARVELDRIAAAGVGLVRQYVWWDRIERSPGSYDWSRTDQMVTDATARGVRILPTLLYPPAFYSSKPPGSTSNALYPPSDPETMARFAEAMVHRYGPNGSYWCTPNPPLPPTCSSPYTPIRAWEVWNEPDYPSWWGGGPDAGEYLELLEAVSAGIRRADPSAEVVLGALTNRASSSGAFLDQLYDLGAAPLFDTIAINPYAKDVAGMVAHVRGVHNVATSNGDGAAPIRVAEYGWATRGDGISPAWSTTEPCQAALLHAATRRLVALRAELNLRSIIQFQWHDVPTTSTAWPHYTGVFRADDTPKPSLGALTEAIASRPPPAGLTLEEACVEDKRDLGPAGPASVADDSFSRTVSDGWGSADVGGSYTVGSGTASSFSVSGGKARVQVVGTSREVVLGSTSARNVDMRASVSTDKAPISTTGLLFTLFARRVAEGTEYRVRARLRADGTVRLSVTKGSGGTETAVGDEVLVSGLSHLPGDSIVLRGQLTGASPTTIRVKAWAVGRREPSEWDLTRTDSEEALQSAGAIGVRATASLLDGQVTFSVDDLHATSPK